MLASIGELGEIGSRTVVTFDEKAGRVPIEIHRDGADLRCVVTAPRLLSVDSSALVAEADKTDGRVVATRVGGHSVLVCDGHMLVE